MTDNNNHIVHKLSLELNVPSKGYARKLSAATRRAIDELSQELDEKFANIFCRIDKLSMELDLYTDKLPAYEKQLKMALDNKLKSLDPLGFETNAQRNLEDIASVRKPEEHQKALVIHFLHTGRLPWWASSDPTSQMETWLYEVTSAEWLETMQAQGKAHPQIFKRLAVQFPPALVDKLVEKSIQPADLSNRLMPLLRELEAFGSEQLADGARVGFVAKLKEQVLMGFCLKNAKEEYIIKEALIVLSCENAKRRVSESITELKNEWKSWLANSENVHKKFWINKTAGISHESPKEIENEFDSSGHFESKVEEDGGGVAVTCGGLVLLHPFITNFFKNVGLLQEGLFTGIAARERAVCLLYYLGTGAEEFLESELELPKFLCSWPGQRPINRFLSLSDYEKDECKSLLSQTIAHWEALKNTSPVGLRSEFIRREGILREEAFGWTLYVEWKTKDILLEQLPWSLSPVKFKWMDKILTVQW